MLVHVGGEDELAALGHLPVQGRGVAAQHPDVEEAGVTGASVQYNKMILLYFIM